MEYPHDYEFMFTQYSSMTSDYRASFHRLEEVMKDPHQPYPDVYLSEEALNVEDVERMEGEGHPISFEGDLGPVTPKAHEEIGRIATPRTQPPEEGYQDETVEGGGEERGESLESTVRGCNCSCPRCPEECPPTCSCAGHTRHKPDLSLSGDEP